MRLIYLTLWGLFFLNTVQAQPTNNPYTARYGGVGHWTDSLKWTLVTDVTTLGAIPNDTLDDSTAIQTGINQIHAAGGGVLFFPAGTYLVSGTLKIKTGVILRGADPQGVTDSRVEGFSPPSKLVFPRYTLDTTANNGTGIDRKKAFKMIKGEYECSNAGVVNLDINRAVIGFHPRFNPNPGPPFQTPQPIEQNRNIIVMGCRTNNAVILDGGVPNLGTPAGSRQRPWQVFPWRFSANIDIFVAQNCVIANNRLNDGPYDNFPMPNYRINRRNTQIWFPLGERTVGTGWKAEFDYNAHYGISLNRAKVYQDTNGRFRIHGVVTYAKPENEPDLFRTGFEILDNWVYKTSRIGITGAGIGLMIKGNVTRDQVGKDTPAFENFTGPTGTVTPQGATTLENRGIDFSGWNVTVDSNDVVCYRNYVQGYLSTDGEGILLQECCGGTQVNDYTITRNKLENYIGIYKMQDINNLKILNNNLGGNTLFVVANTNNNAHFLNNFLLEGNTQVGGITATGTRGGFNGFIRNNSGTGTPNLSCHVRYEDNNTGFNPPVYRAVDPNNLANHTPPIVPGPCQETTAYPKVEMVRPTQDTTYGVSMTQYTIIARLTQGDIFTAKIDFLQGTQVVAANLSPDLVDSTVRYTWTVPANPASVTAFTARVRDGGLEAMTEVRRFTRVVPITSVSDKASRTLGIKVYPNPTERGGQLYVSGLESTNGLEIRLLDLQGKEHPIRWNRDGNILRVNPESLPSGAYILDILTEGQRYRSRVLNP